MAGRFRPAFSEYRPESVLLPESFCVPLRRRLSDLSRSHRPIDMKFRQGKLFPLPQLYHPKNKFVKTEFPRRVSEDFHAWSSQAEAAFYRRVGASCYLYVLITDSATSRLDMR